VTSGLSPNTPNKYVGPNVANCVVVSRNRAPLSTDYRQPETGKLYAKNTLWNVSKDPTTGDEGDSWYLSKIVANVAYWVQIGDSSGDLYAKTITGDDSIALPPDMENWNIYGQQNGSIPVMQTIGSGSTLSIEDRTSTTAFVVDPSSTVGLRGTYSTIQAAINAAVSGQTIFIKSGTYTENLTLKAGVNLVSYDGGYTPNVTIAGKCSFSSSGVVTLSNLRLQTNGDYSISVTGSVSSRLFIVNCYLDCLDFTHIQLASTGSSPSIRVINSWLNTQTLSYGVFAVTGTASLTFFGVNALENSNTTVQSTFASSNTLIIRWSSIRFPITTSGTGRISADHVEFNTYENNRQSLTIGATSGTNNNYLRNCTVISGTAVAITVTSNLYINSSGIYSENSIPIDGNGTLVYTNIGFMYDNPLLPATPLTLDRRSVDNGKIFGNFSGSTITAGYLGEYISSFIPYNGSTVALTTATAVDVTSIVLTPGNWDVTGIVMFSGLTTTTHQIGSIGVTSATIANSTYGNQTVATTFTNSGATDIGITIPSYRVRVTVANGTKTLYLRAEAAFTASSSPNTYGRISATRVN
jgi:hypothetical protein